MTEHHWDDTYAKACKLFGEIPSAQFEQAVIDHFETNPQKVNAQIEHIGKQIKNGATISSGWAVLRKRLQAAPTENVVATDQQHAKTVTQHAKQYIHNTGAYLDETQIRQELTDRGIKDHDTTDSLLAYWREQRTAMKTRRAQEAATPPEPKELPDWVRRWRAARDANDQRLLPEQEKGIIWLHETHLEESLVRRKEDGKQMSGYEDMILALTAPHDDPETFIQPHEYADAPPIEAEDALPF